MNGWKGNKIADNHAPGMAENSPPPVGQYRAFFLTFWQIIKRGYNDENEKTGTRRPPINENLADPKPEALTDREIVEQYRPTIDRLCRRYSKDNGAEMRSDLMAEALKAHRRAKTARDHGAYVKRCLYNRAFHLYRAGKRQRDFERAAADFSLDAPAGKTGRDTLTPLVECIADENQLDLAEALELKIRRQVVLDALRHSPRLKAVAEMIMSGYSHSEIARFYGLSHERPRQLESQIIRTVRLELGIDFEGNPIERKRRNVQRPL